MWSSIAAAQRVVRIETYIWKAGIVADRFLEELHAAAARGVRVEILVDAFGSERLGPAYFRSLQGAGARVVWFNQSRYFRGSFRNHRKLMTVDGHLAIVGGLNIGDEYDGDGIATGWRDFAVELRGPIVASLDSSMDQMFQLAGFTPMAVARFARRYLRHHDVDRHSTGLLLSGPGTRSGRLQRVIRSDLAAGRELSAYAAYLLPTWQIRRAMRAVARRGRVRLITGAQSDVPLVRWAAQRLYPFWLRGGVALYEYQPQIVHAKLIVLDDVVYAGSANLDIRSLRINYELMVRIPSRSLAEQVRQVFDGDLTRSERIDPAEWGRHRRWWQSLRSLWAYLLLVRLDPFLAGRGLRRPS